MKPQPASSYGWPWDAHLRLPRFGHGVGLHRMQALAEPLFSTRWGAQVEALKITGSNGKGSVCALLASALQELGVRFGRYTSPHLCAFNERVVVDGLPAGDTQLDEAWAWLAPRLASWQAQHPDDTPGLFEAATLLAWRVFEQAGLALVVSEAGIGGRYDPTRLLPGPVAALTSVDLEHTALLGATHELIAYDKADLCPEGGVLVACLPDSDLRRRLAGYCALRRVRLVDAARPELLRRVRDDGAALVVDLELDGWRLDDLRLALRGPHQARNAVVALLVLREWLARRPAAPPRDVLEAALRRAWAVLRWPGRFERAARDPDVYVDVAHTPDATQALAETVRATLGDCRPVLLCGVSADKDARALLAPLAPLACEALAVCARTRGAPAAAVAATLAQLRPGLEPIVCASVAEGLQQAQARARRRGAPVLVGGGLFVAAEALAVLRGLDPAHLRLL